MRVSKDLDVYVQCFQQINEGISHPLCIVIWNKDGQIYHVHGNHKDQSTCTVCLSNNIIGKTYGYFKKQAMISVTKDFVQELKDAYDRALHGYTTSNKSIYILNNGEIMEGLYKIYPLYSEKNKNKHNIIIGVCQVIQATQKDIYGLVDYFVDQKLSLQKIRPIIDTYYRLFPNNISENSHTLMQILKKRMHASRNDIINLLKTVLGDKFCMTDVTSLENKLNSPITDIYKHSINLSN